MTENLQNSSKNEEMMFLPPKGDVEKVGAPFSCSARWWKRDRSGSTPSGAGGEEPCRSEGGWITRTCETFLWLGATLDPLEERHVGVLRVSCSKRPYTKIFIYSIVKLTSIDTILFVTLLWYLNSLGSWWSRCKEYHIHWGYKLVFMWYGNEATVARLKYVVYLSLATGKNWAPSF